MSIEDFGKEVRKNEILKVQLSFHSGKWYVEYRRKPKFYIDKWWWFDDSIHTNYNDAFVRAQTLAALGYYETIENKKLQFNTNNGEV